MEIAIIAAIIVSVPIILYLLGVGKFWHKHRWELSSEIVMDSIYSENKNMNRVYKCKNCRSFKIIVTKAKENDERV